AKRAIEPRVPMTVDVAPERADAVEIATTFGVDEEVPVAPRDHERRPLGHLREWVPKHPLIELLEMFHVIRRTASFTAVAMVWRSSAVCPAARLMRSRAVPSGTVGGRMPWMNTRRSSTAALTAIVRRSSPITSGAIALVGAPPMPDTAS